MVRTGRKKRERAKPTERAGAESRLDAVSALRRNGSGAREDTAERNRGADLLRVATDAELDQLERIYAALMMRQDGR